jgi:hypothetical protein
MSCAISFTALYNLMEYVLYKVVAVETWVKSNFLCPLFFWGVRYNFRVWGR